jgi:L-ribulose-5-phosphate 4-epimerase
MSTEGFVRYQCERLPKPAVRFPGFAELKQSRTRLRQLDLIGVYPDGIGYGNISIRAGEGGFYISGAATGDLLELGEEHYAKVTAYDFARNWVRCEGPIQASSESMTHAAIYAADPTANAVIHVHDATMWRALLDRVPTTSAAVEYGTPEMAYEIGRLFKETDVQRQRIVVMAGHEEGIITFGVSLSAAFEVLLLHRNADSSG